MTVTCLKGELTDHVYKVQGDTRIGTMTYQLHGRNLTAAIQDYNHSRPQFSAPATRLAVVTNSIHISDLSIKNGIRPVVSQNKVSPCKGLYNVK